MIEHSTAKRVLAWLCFCFCAIIPGLQAADEWHVADSVYRYKLELVDNPSHPSAGYFVHLPVADILHGAVPSMTVTTLAGKVIPSYLLWHNEESGFSMVFAAPGGPAQAVYVYVQTNRLPQLWNPKSGITPSAILCTQPYTESIGAAQTLGSLGHVEPSVSARSHTGVNRAPLSIGGDLTGRPRPGAFYFLSYVEAAEAGNYWIAPFTFDGQCKVLIDGDKIDPKERSKHWGGTGASVNLTKGLHRVEIFQTAGGTGPYADDKNFRGLMYLAWRPPSEKIKARDADARVIANSEIVRSGACELTSVEAKNGTPVAIATATPGACYWFEDEEPLIIYDLNAVTAGQSADTTYTWAISKGAVAEGDKVQWLFPGFTENTATLTAKSARGSSTCVVPFFSFSTKKTSLDKFETREAYRKVLSTVLKGLPRSPDPVAGWSNAWWNNLMRTADGGSDEAILMQLFTNHLDGLKRINPSQLGALQDTLLDLMQRQKPSEALQWLRQFKSSAPSVARTNELILREGELLLFSLEDRKQAEQVLTSVADLSGESAERAKIRLGDLALLQGDLNKATSFYADVQKRARARRNATAFIAPEAPKPLFPGALSQPTGSGADQKRGALQEVSYSENVRTLIEDNFLPEARQALLAWEIEFPLSKISSDYIIRESALYIKMGDWKRARLMLEAYCREIDASSFLPAAASVLISCVQGSKEPPSPSIIETIEKVKGRLKFHPVAEELERFLSAARTPSH
ncbi:MAG: hypothetical protein WCP06_07475 [Verrucomicrobiota bacterium]